MSSGDRDPTNTLGTLQNVVASAARIAQDLLQDPLLARLLDIFGRMPPEDRQTIVDVLEREVDLRLLTKEGKHGPMTGINVTRPNPTARLYFRVVDKETVPYVSPEEIVQAVIRAAGVMHRAFQRGSDMQTIWEPAIVAGLQQVDPTERETLRWYYERMMTLVREAYRDSD